MAFFDKLNTQREKAGAMASRHQDVLSGATRSAGTRVANTISGALGMNQPAPAPMFGGTGASFSVDGMEGWTGSNIMGSGSRGDLQRANIPAHLQNSPLGFMQQGLLAGLFGDSGVNRQFLNQDLANIRSSTQQAQQDFKGNARFRGSGVGEAISQAIGQAGTATESRRFAQADQEELQRALALSNAITSGFTNPLLSGMGMASQSYDNMMQRAMTEGMQPSGFEKGMGMVTGLLDAYMPG